MYTRTRGGMRARRKRVDDSVAYRLIDHVAVFRIDTYIHIDAWLHTSTMEMYGRDRARWGSVYIYRYDGVYKRRVCDTQTHAGERRWGI